MRSSVGRGSVDSSYIDFSEVGPILLIISNTAMPRYRALIVFLFVLVIKYIPPSEIYTRYRCKERSKDITGYC